MTPASVPACVISDISDYDYCYNYDPCLTMTPVYVPACVISDISDYDYCYDYCYGYDPCLRTCMRRCMADCMKEVRIFSGNSSHVAPISPGSERERKRERVCV